MGRQLGSRSGMLFALVLALHKRASRKLLNGIGITNAVVLESAGAPGYAGSWARKPPSLAVALNCGTGSSFLKALVKAFDKLHMVRGENSGYCGPKYRR